MMVLQLSLGQADLCFVLAGFGVAEFGTSVA